jgi:hypothetical protein
MIGTIILGVRSGWMYCGALIFIGWHFIPMNAPLVVHVIDTSFGFILIPLLYYRLWPIEDFGPSSGFKKQRQ